MKAVPPVSTRPHLARGFTLIEIMMVVLILGIVVAVALPSYRSAQQKAGRAEAKAALLEVASMQERFYTTNNSYSTNASPLASPAVASFTSESGKYVVTVAACSGGTIAACFLATATPQGAQASDVCGNLTLSSTGVRGSSAGVPTECWEG